MKKAKAKPKAVKPRRIDNKTWLVVVLIIVVAVSLSYIVISEQSRMSQSQEFDAYSQGFNDGAAQAIIEIMNRASQCQVVPLFVDNYTVDLVSVDCLQQAQG